MQPSPGSFLTALVLFAVVGLIFAAIPARIYGYGQRMNVFLGWPKARVIHGFLPDSPRGVRVLGMAFVCFAVALAAFHLWQLSTLA